MQTHRCMLNQLVLTLGRSSAATVSHSGLPSSAAISSTKESTSAARSRPNLLAQARRGAEAGGPILEGLETTRASSSEIDGLTIWWGSLPESGGESESRIRSDMVEKTYEPMAKGSGADGDRIRYF